MAQPTGENGDRVPRTSRRVSSDPTMLKVLLRERHWQNYGMFTRAYQNAAKSLDKDLAQTYPSLSTFRRWLAGQVQDLPHAQHCVVLEAMLPGWTAAELFQPPHQPEDLTGSTPLHEIAEPAEPASPHQPATAMPAAFSRAIEDGNGDTGVVGGRRRIVGCDARGVPFREEVRMAAEESAQFQRWSATTNVDDTVLEQMTADVADLAYSEQIDPPATTYARLLGARDDVFRLIAGHQQPRHTTTLYKIAGQITAMLAIVTSDLGHPHAANTHARTALHCAEISGYTPLRVVIRWTQSSEAYWDGRYDEAAQLVDAALPDATSGTTLLLLASQQARINAARNRPDEMNQALALAETAAIERTPDEPGVLGCDAGRAALYASDAHYTLGGTDHLDTAAQWAHTALDEFTTEYRSVQARFSLATAYLGKGDLEAVGEHLAPILHATDAQYRTVPIIGRARSLHALLDQRTDLTSPTLTTLRDDLAGFITHPAPTPPQLEPDTAT
ncbi:MAG: hypothetical protein ACRDTC_23930 [Pseudonocardiaceae bacterium]